MRRGTLATIALALALGTAACSGSPAVKADEAAGAAQNAPGGAFRLTDTNGKVVTEQTLKGKPYAIFFGFTRCPDICPTSMSRMALLHKKLGADGDKMNIVFVSVDPEHDKREDIASFLSMFDAPVIGLTGEPAELKRIEEAYKIYVERVPLPNGDYTIDHTARILLFDRNGDFATTMDAAEPEDRALTRLRNLIRA
ncbi:SCO family protein [Sphingomonas sp.]|jgi:protein SCO1/2|uniref:SCO family protein n=1 Tax=Sphingomonas sp. TaxID=28214 RepID=UPI0026115FF3|nr:SCO family protein [Sphingomonas sp.]MDF2495556.1 electron transporter SenC [Sphingomonas sp.]